MEQREEGVSEQRDEDTPTASAEDDAAPSPTPSTSAVPTTASSSFPGGYVCTTCGAKFSRKFNRDRHIRLNHNNIAMVYDCTFCGAFFDSLEKLRQHRESHEPSTSFKKRESAFRKKCVVYRKIYDKKILTLEDAFLQDKNELRRLISFEADQRKSMKVGLIYHAEFVRLLPRTAGEEDEGEGEEVEREQIAETNTADEEDGTPMEGEEENEDEIAWDEEQFGGAAGDGDEGEERDDPFLSDHPYTGKKRVGEGQQEETVSAADAAETVYEICLRSPSANVTPATSVQSIIFAAHQHIQQRAADFLENGSGWRLNAIICADVEIGSCAALNGSCNLISVNFLSAVEKTKKSEDLQECFLHACAYHFVKTDDTEKLNKFIRKNFVVKISSPVKVGDIARFERHNKHLKMKINVIYKEETKIYPLLFSKNISAKHHITLILYKTEFDGGVVSHYSYVTDVSKMLRRCYKRGNHYSYEKSISCLNCFAKFSTQYGHGAHKGQGGREKLRQHYEQCMANKPQNVKIPEEGSTIHFKNHVNKFPAHFVGYFDFESRHRKEKYECDKCKKVDDYDDTPCYHQTRVKAIQEPITYSYLILDKHEKIIFHNTYSGEDCVKRFLQELISIEEELLAALNNYNLLDMTTADEASFAAATQCHICGAELEGDAVRDHCHVSGKFLGAAHKMCNLLRVERKKIPMFCHNLSGYDGHFLMQNLGKIDGVKNLSALPYNTEKFRCIEMNSFHFLDSLSFLNASLDELMKNLRKNKQHPFSIIDQLEFYTPGETEKKDLLLRKGVFPYEYATSIKKLKKTLQIPKKKYFFSSLTNSNVSEEDYAHSKKVFREFGCTDMVR